MYICICMYMYVYMYINREIDYIGIGWHSSLE